MFIALICVFIILLVLYITCKKYTIESFYQHCSFLADSGLICALEETNDDYIIKRYQETSDNMQKQVINELQKEWEFYNHSYIISNWSDSGVFYVMTTIDEKEFIGSIAVDRKNFYPYISQLYIVESKRNNGYAKILLSFAEKYTIEFGFNTARLWCSKDLIKFYEKLDWIVIEKDKDRYIMEKSL
jgi:GNAT superfamily N-acetyltransferase